MAPVLGPIVSYIDGEGVQIIDKREYHFNISNENGLVVTYSPYSSMDRYVISHLRAIARKVAYCIGCKACSVQCPTGAFNIDNDGKILAGEE